MFGFEGGGVGRETWLRDGHYDRYAAIFQGEPVYAGCRRTTDFLSHHVTKMLFEYLKKLGTQKYWQLF